MLADQLTKPLTKKLLFSLLLVAVGSDIILYLTRFSYLAETLYTNILLFGIFVGIRLAPRLSGLQATRDKNPKLGLKLDSVPGLGMAQGPGIEMNQVPGLGMDPEPELKLKPVSEPGPKKRLFSVFTKAFFLFYIFNLVNNIYISEAFPAFDESAAVIAEDFSSMASEFEGSSSEGSTGAEFTSVDRVFEWIDTVGFDFFDSFIAGLEEVWRLSYIVLFLAFFKKIFPKVWQRSSKDSFMILAIIFSSILFGVGHSLSVEQEWTVFVGTVVNYTNMGLILGYLLISTKNLWLLVFIHGLYNVLATISWHYFALSLEVFVLIILFTNWLVINFNRRAVIPTNYPPGNKQIGGL